MATKPNRLSLFWQELKRRNVVRVLTVYAGAAFVILELVDIIADPLKLPSWLLPVVIVLLSIGFIIAVILSWIYDIHPDGGMVKTEPEHKTITEGIHKSSNGWKIASYISFVVILGLLALNIFLRKEESSRRADLEHSIAVLPFHNDSPEQKNTHIIDGCMVQILNNLSKIQDLRVSARASVEVYREHLKPPREIAQELGVSYLLSGSGQKIENRILLTIELADADGNIIWSQPYDRRIHNAEDQFRLQSEIAELVVEEIDVRITPEEKSRIGSIPTQSTIAHELFLKGYEEIAGYMVNQGDESVLETARILLNASLVFDSSYAEVYMSLANISWLRNFNRQYYSDTYLDSALALANHALSLDAQLSEAYTLRGRYYLTRGQHVKALEEFNQAIHLNPNDWRALLGLASYYVYLDVPRSLDFYKRVISLYKGPQLPSILREMGHALSNAGFVDEAVSYFHRAAETDGDSTKLYFQIFSAYSNNGLFKEAKSISEILYTLDSTYVGSNDFLGWLNLIMGNKQEALKQYKNWYARMEATGEVVVYGLHWMALAYWENGFTIQAEEFFDKQVNQILSEQKLGRLHDALLYSYFDLASIQAFRGEKQNALENLRTFSEKKIMLVYIPTHIKYGPFFDTLKNDPEFIEIFEEIETKYRTEHERVRQWLEENEIF